MTNTVADYEVLHSLGSGASAVVKLGKNKRNQEERAINIFFNDGNERPVTFYHILKLFHGANTPANAPAIPVDVTKGNSLQT